MKLTALIDLKCQNEKRKQEGLQMQSELGFRLDEARAQAEIALLEKDQAQVVNDELESEENRLL